MAAQFRTPLPHLFLNKCYFISLVESALDPLPNKENILKQLNKEPEFNNLFNKAESSSILISSDLVVQARAPGKCCDGCRTTHELSQTAATLAYFMPVNSRNESTSTPGEKKLPSIVGGPIEAVTSSIGVGSAKRGMQVDPSSEPFAEPAEKPTRRPLKSRKPKGDADVEDPDTPTSSRKKRSAEDATVTAEPKQKKGQVIPIEELW
jgi:hypothetical protein